MGMKTNHNMASSSSCWRWSCSKCSVSPITSLTLCKIAAASWAEPSKTILSHRSRLRMNWTKKPIWERSLKLMIMMSRWTKNSKLPVKSLIIIGCSKKHKSKTNQRSKNRSQTPLSKPTKNN